MKHTYILVLLTLLLSTMYFGVVKADVSYPPQMDWYAIVMDANGGSLSFIHANGEHLLIPLPIMQGEISVTQTRLHVSPNGHYLLSIAPLNTGREGIGLYSFETGQWVQTHQTQENEVVMNAGRYPFTETSSHFVLSLRNQITGQWRMLVFDSQANVVANLPMSSQLLPQSIQNATDWFPIVSFFNFDEGFNMLDVRFHMMSDNQELNDLLTPLKWFIPQQGDQQSVSPDGYRWGRAGFDVNPMTGRVVSTYNNPNVAAAPSFSAGNSITTQASADSATQYVITEAGTNIRLARWLNNGNWIGYWRENQVQQPHWMVMNNEDSNGMPLGPNLTGVYNVADGFIAHDTSTNTLYHATSLNFEAFSTSVGNVIYQRETPFRVIYTTPTNTAFTLQQVTWQYFDGNAVPEALQVATSCDTNAPAARLTVGQDARITFTDGTLLNIRTAPAGEFIMQMPEGTVATVIEGPVCEDNYQWWNLSFNNGTGGWAAEGDFDEYYLEPYVELQVAPPVAQATPMVIAPPVAQATPMVIAPPVAQTTPMVIAPPVAQTTPQLQLQAQVYCQNSPTKRLTIGQQAHSLPELDGTLAMRINLSDEFPTYQVPAAVTMQVIAGPSCHNNITMWQVQLTLNGQTVTGWLAEGYGNNYYLAPGAA